MQTVNAQPGRPNGVVLLLAASLIAVMVGVVFSFTPGVGADPCDTVDNEDEHQVTSGHNCGDSNHGTDDHYRIWVHSFNGERGDRFTLEGRGFPPGTVTIFEGNVDSGEIIDDEIVRDNGEFDVTLTLRGRLGILTHTVSTVDSEGNETSVTFDITKPRISFEPERVVADSKVRIIIQDWQDNQQDIVGVSIAGEYAFPKDAIEYSNCIGFVGREISTDERVLTLEVRCPRASSLGNRQFQFMTMSNWSLPLQTSQQNPLVRTCKKKGHGFAMLHRP